MSYWRNGGGQDSGKPMSVSVTTQSRTYIIEQSSTEYTNRSIRVVVDLSVVHNEVSLGLELPSIVYLWVTVEKADNDFTYKLKQTNNLKSSVFSGVQGGHLDQHEFLDIFVSNLASSGEAVIQVGWKE